MRTSRLAMCLMVVFLVAPPIVLAQEAKQEVDRDFSPCVVKTVPANRAKNVDYRLREIKVTFDRPMFTEGMWSWIILRANGVYPGTRGGPKPRWEDGGRTCVLTVRFSPDTVYAIGVNSPRHTGFRGAKGKVAVPHAWVFKTKK